MSDVPGTIIFSIFYFLFSLGFLYESKEFRGFGLTAEHMLRTFGFVADEENHFIKYHVRRTSGTIVLRALLPFVYLLTYSYVSTFIDGNYSSMLQYFQDNHWAAIFFKLSAVICVLAASYSWYLSLNNCTNHPIINKISAYAQGSVETLILDIDHEFRRVDKVCVEVNSVTHLVITDNWILLLGSMPHQFHICHQHDANLTILASDSHNLSPEGDAGGSQYLRIQVDNRKPGISGFEFRVNSLEYQNIQTKLQAQIQNAQNIQISKSVSDRFVDVFTAEVEANPRVIVTDHLEPCIGCMVNQANVKLVRVCGTANDAAALAAGEGPAVAGGGCVNCYCRPMWCVSCVAKWFASRQNQAEPDTWLGSRCPCPTCRSKFCVLDVALVQQES